MSERRFPGDLAFALFCLAVAGVTWLEARKLPPSPFDPLGPGSVPIMLCGALAFLALVLLVKFALGLEIGSAGQSLIIGMTASEGATHTPRPTLAIVSFALTLVYVAAMHLKLVSFLPATIVYLAVLGALMLPRRLAPQLIGLAIAVAGGVGLYWIFTRVIVVDLP